MVGSIGAYGAMSVVGKTGWYSIIALGKLMLAFTLCALFIFVILAIVLKIF